ncbi:trypsin A chain (extracellular trypsin protease) [Stagonosporopsis vannaccii]|nr:trypsin A chain (extracellular trypsin protease) [Stagonosporopsis vannaccii]
MATKLILAVLAIPTMLCTALNTVPARNSTNRIIGGVTAQKGDFPFTVSLQLMRGARHFCAGSLLDSTTVLTAAHCLHLSTSDWKASDMNVRARSLSSKSGGTLARVSSVVAHPNYTGGTLANDIGIVKLHSPLAAEDGIAFASMASSGSDPDAGTMTTVAGWGDTYPGDRNGSRQLREVDVPVVSRETCATIFRDLEYDSGDLYPNVTEDMICAGYIDDFDNGKDSCQGDSGGPLVDTNTGIIVRVVSWGSPECGRDGHIGVYARVGHARSFIDKYTERSY